jgi:hypothetical protein
MSLVRNLRLNGNYMNLDSGSTADALVDFTAGVAESGC